MVLRQAGRLAPNEHLWLIYLSSFIFTLVVKIPNERKAAKR